jgi:hypothetical protein
VARAGTLFAFEACVTRETDEWFFSDNNELGRQARIPLMVHADKMRLLEVNCPKEARLSGIRGPDAGVHYEYHAKHHSPAYVDEELAVTGRIFEPTPRASAFTYTTRLR